MKKKYKSRFNLNDIKLTKNGKVDLQLGNLPHFANLRNISIESNTMSINSNIINKNIFKLLMERIVLYKEFSIRLKMKDLVFDIVKKNEDGSINYFNSKLDEVNVKVLDKNLFNGERFIRNIKNYEDLSKILSDDINEKYKFLKVISNFDFVKTITDNLDLGKFYLNFNNEKENYEIDLNYLFEVYCSVITFNEMFIKYE